MGIPPTSLYVHFPWCAKKCPYCDFNSHALKQALDEPSYLRALIADLDHEMPLVQDRNLESIFLGGGTPSLFSAKAISSLLQAIRDRFPLSESTEITMEANPGSLEHDQFDRYLRAGINRLSLGIQSFNDDHLKTLGRIHDSHTAEKAITAARQAGFENLNIDLMYGLPYQTVDMAVTDCNRAMEHSPAHISYYQLTIEPQTRFFVDPPELPGNDRQFEMQLAIQQRLREEGYFQYEVSAYSVPNRECVHNVNYWEFGDYLGIGAGAHSKMTENNRVSRFWKQKHPETYMDQVSSNGPYRTRTMVRTEDLLFEFMLNGLRLKNGVELAKFEQRTGLPTSEIQQRLSGILDSGWVHMTDHRITCSDQGYLFIDEILQTLLPDPDH